MNENRYILGMLLGVKGKSEEENAWPRQSAAIRDARVYKNHKTL